MKRYYENILISHFAHNRQMFFIAGPRQVGKTTLSMCLKKDQGSRELYYLNWDNFDHRDIILAGPLAIAKFANYNTLVDKHLIFDEIHKYKHWKNLLKGFFDTYQDKFKIIVTGSAKLNLYQQGGDSMMGRYFLYRIFPLTLAEIINPNFTIVKNEIQAPQKANINVIQDLLKFGGFPEPFIKKDNNFYNKWINLRNRQLFTEDINELADVKAINEINLLARIIPAQAAAMLNRSSLARKIKVSVPTISSWLSLFEQIYYIYPIKPWHKNITRSLIKEPKIYMWDWSQVQDIGAKFENLIALHLFKAVCAWNDQGLGEYDLFYLRDKEQREVDFLVVRNNQPWFLVEAKCSQASLINPNLAYFQHATNAKHAFQVVLDADFVDADCFSRTEPTIVPALTFLSQLV